MGQSRENELEINLPKGFSLREDDQNVFLMYGKIMVRVFPATAIGIKKEIEKAAKDYQKIIGETLF